MGPNPGETTEQWFLRATANYQDAWDTLQVVSSRLGLKGPPFLDSAYPLLDAAYDGAMDRLDAADDDRAEASIALDRERRPIS